jgi:acyl carrier protein
MSPPLSSRTPEGQPNRCPVCGEEVCLEPSQPPGDAPCPRCGHLLWILETSSGMRAYDAEDAARVREKLLSFFCDGLGVRREVITDSTPLGRESGSDSLDTVGLVMDIEEEFCYSLSFGKIGKIETFGDLVDSIRRERRR